MYVCVLSMCHASAKFNTVHKSLFGMCVHVFMTSIVSLCRVHQFYRQFNHNFYHMDSHFPNRMKIFGLFIIRQ